MRHIARSLALVVAVGFGACGSSKLGGSGAGAAGSGGGASGSGGKTGGGGATTGTGGTTGGTTAGTSGTVAGSAGREHGGSSGGPAGTGGGGTMGTAGIGGAAAGPLRLIVFYTRWGTAYPEWFPSGSERAFTMSTMMQALEPYKHELIVLSGLTNANLYPDSTGTSLGSSLAMDGVPPDQAMSTLLTARPTTAAGSAAGPSLDTAIGTCGGAAGPPLRLVVGQFGYDDGPGVSFDASGAAIRGERDPHAVAARVLGHDVTAPKPGDDMNASYPALGAADMAIAAEALATSKTCVVTLMWGDHVAPTWLGLDMMLPDLSHETDALYLGVATQNPPSNPNGSFQKMQAWYALQFASLLDRLRAVPLGDGTLLDRSVVLWISESGQGSDHRGLYVPVVIGGGGGGRLDLGRFIEVEPHAPAAGSFIDVMAVGRTQGDLLAAVASLWNIASFGDPQITRQPLTALFRP